MERILRHAFLAVLCLQAFEIKSFKAAKQQVQLSDSFLPVAMQVIAHLTDQMSFEAKEESGTKPTTRPTTKPSTAKPTTNPQHNPTTAKPLYVTSGYFESLHHKSVRWWMPFGITRDLTTPFHRPGYYAPASPPKPSERVTGKKQQYNFPSQNKQYASPNQQTYVPINPQFYVPPVPINQQNNVFFQKPTFNSSEYQQPYSFNQQNQFYIPPSQQSTTIPPQQSYLHQQFNSSQNYYQYNPFINQKQSQKNGVMTFDFPQYKPIQPANVRNEEPLLSAHHEEFKPLVDPTPESPQLLPPHFEADIDKISSRSKGFDEDELTEENLQYLSQNVRDMIRMANDPYDERLVDVWDGLRANPAEPTSKGKLSASNLRLLLLYDLLSREAKRQKLSDYSGFSPDVMKTLVESSSGGARAQLSMALSKMVERHDCAHEYANNRAKEMVTELGKDESKLSSEIRYLQPLVYKY